VRRRTRLKRAQLPERLAHDHRRGDGDVEGAAAAAAASRQATIVRWKFIGGSSRIRPHSTQQTGNG
jgi:hypothetical protein